MARSGVNFVVLSVASWLLVQGNAVTPEPESESEPASEPESTTLEPKFKTVWSFLLTGLNYEVLSSSPAMSSSISSAVRDLVASAAGVSADTVTLEFLPGSLIIRTTIMTPEAHAVDNTNLVDLSQTMATSLAAIPNMEDYTSGNIVGNFCPDGVCAQGETTPATTKPVITAPIAAASTTKPVITAPIASASMPANTDTAVALGAAAALGDAEALNNGLLNQASAQGPPAAFAEVSLPIGFAASFMAVAAMLALVAGAFAFQNRQVATPDSSSLLTDVAAQEE